MSRLRTLYCLTNNNKKAFWQFHITQKARTLSIPIPRLKREEEEDGRERNLEGSTVGAHMERWMERGRRRRESKKKYTTWKKALRRECLVSKICMWVVASSSSSSSSSDISNYPNQTEKSKSISFFWEKEMLPAAYSGGKWGGRNVFPCFLGWRIIFFDLPISKLYLKQTYVGLPKKGARNEEFSYNSFKHLGNRHRFKCHFFFIYRRLPCPGWSDRAVPGRVWAEVYQGRTRRNHSTTAGRKLKFWFLLKNGMFF